MTKRMLIDAIHTDESRVVIVGDRNRIEEFDFTTSTKKQVKGNIYLAKVTRVEPSLQAAFIEYGGGKQGFLPFSEIHSDYYQIPADDRAQIEAEQEAFEREQEEIDAREDARLAAQPTELNADQAGTDALPESPEIPYSDADNPYTPASEVGAMPVMPAHIEGADDVQYASETTEAVEPEAITDFSQPEPGSAVVVTPEDKAAGAEVETLANEEELVRQRRRPNFFRRYRIQEVIKRNQILLVQVIKEERGNKGVSLTTYISLAGRYCVLMPNSPKDGGVSRKISSGEDRRRLKQILSDLRMVRGMSIIIRTAGMDRTHAEIKRDFEYLVKLWETIREKTLSSSAPAQIYEEGDLVKRSIRDLYNSEIEEVLVEGEDAFNQAKEFMKMLMPSHAPRVKHYKDSTPLFYAYDMEDQLVSMYDPSVKLRSGGYIVISPTEALTSVDVNSGRSTGERNIEETAVKTNMEAAWEIARQIRLRDLAGLLVIDFIDMLEGRNRRAVERTLRDALKQDRAKIQLGRISPFGLLEMSRQRMRPSISETSTMVCPHCLGKGTVRSHASMSIQILRALKKEASEGMYAELKLSTTATTALYLLNNKKEPLAELEEEYDIRITVLVDAEMPAAGFRIDKIKLPPEKRRARPEREHHRTEDPVTIDSPEMAGEIPGEVIDDNNNDGPRFVEDRENSHGRTDRPDRGPRRRTRGGRGRARPNDRNNRGDRGDRPPRDENTTAPAEGDAIAVDAAPTDGAPREPRESRPRGERGNRGGRGRSRRWRGEGKERGPRSDNPEGGNDASAPQSGSSARPDTDQAPSAPREFPSKREPSFQSPAPEPAFAGNGGEDTSKQPARKGWWRKMVE